VRCQVLTAASMKMAVFWDVAPCSLVEVMFQRYLLPPSSIALMMDAANTSETLVNYQTTRCNIPEDSHFRYGFSLLIL
jgi:hypothetical protein